MNRQHDRAWLLYQQEKYDLAENEVRQALVMDPHDAQAHALLALCLKQRDALEEATKEAQYAVHEEPDQPLSYFALASVLHARNHFEPASEAIEQAILLNPLDSSLYGLQSAIELSRRNWKAALESADRGLQVDPDDTACTNLRVVALRQLGRKAEAASAAGTLLSRAPDDAMTHANQGWTCLHQNQPQQAKEHFREALRLDPDSDWAREGMLSAMRAQSPIYRALFRTMAWLERLSHRSQWIVLIVLWVGYQVFRQIALANPVLEPFVLPAFFIYMGVILLTWIAEPLFNLTLFVNPFGRLILNPKEKIASGIVGMLVVVAITGIFASIWLGLFPVLVSVYCMMLIIPVSLSFQANPGPRRVLIVSCAIGLGLTGMAALAATLVGLQIGVLLFMGYGLGILFFSIGANVLAMKPEKR